MEEGQEDPEVLATFIGRFRARFVLPRLLVRLGYFPISTPARETRFSAIPSGLPFRPVVRLAPPWNGASETAGKKRKIPIIPGPFHRDPVKTPGPGAAVFPGVFPYPCLRPLTALKGAPRLRLQRPQFDGAGSGH